MTGPTFEIVPHPHARDPNHHPGVHVAVTHNSDRSDGVLGADNPLRGNR